MVVSKGGWHQAVQQSDHPRMYGSSWDELSETHKVLRIKSDTLRGEVEGLPMTASLNRAVFESQQPLCVISLQASPS